MKLGINYRTVPVSSNYTATIFDDMINVDASNGTIRITLFDANLAADKGLIINKVDTTNNLVLVVSPYGQMLSTIVLGVPGESQTLVTVGPVWSHLALGGRSVQSYIDASDNVIINGDISVNQRFPTNPATFFSTSATQRLYYVDRNRLYCQGPTSKSFSFQTTRTTVPTVSQCGYAATSLLIINQGSWNITTGDSVQTFCISVEGYDYQKLHGQLCSLNFWFFATVAGTYSVTIAPNDVQTYAATFDVLTPSTWQFVSIPVDFNISSSGLNFDSNLGIQIIIAGIGEPALVAPSLNAWNSGFYIASPGFTPWNTTAGAQMAITLISLVKGVGVRPNSFPRLGRTYQQELAASQRYCNVNNGPGGSNAARYAFGYFFSSTQFTGQYKFPVTMRAIPTMSFSGTFVTRSATHNGNVVNNIFDNSTSNFDVGVISAAVNATDSGPAELTTTDGTGQVIFDAELL